MKHIYLSVGMLLFAGMQLTAQCPQITCPSNITVNNDPGVCGAVVTYTAPVGTDPCAASNVAFSYTGAIVTWTVPAGVTSININALGAQGGYNTNSTTQPGLGASITGTFSVTPGQQLQILVGQQPSNGSGNGGGGGTFVCDMSNNPLVVAGGGGGSSQGMDSPDKHGQAGTTGGTGAGGGGTGGTSGSGGSIGSSGFQSGAGGGLLSNGADGWTSGTGGSAYISGGAGGATNAPANGGFGGGGSGSSYVVGGGGGGYSGGGSGGNSTAGVGGGGGSYNGGSNPVNQTGINSGNGSVTITYNSSVTVTTVLDSGLASGSTFPVGVNTVSYKVSNSLGDSAVCSFTVTVTDTEAPQFTSCGTDTTSCDSVMTNIGPGTVTDNCTVNGITYVLSGATTGTGTNDASGTTFHTGSTLVKYIATDIAGNSDTCTFTVTVNPIPVVTASAATPTVCISGGNVALTGTPALGTWTGNGVSGTSFIPANAGLGIHTLTYTFTNGAGCTDSADVQVEVLGCAGLESPELVAVSIYPNPAGEFLVISSPLELKDARLTITDLNGKQVLSKNQPVSTQTQLNVEELAPGIYLLNLHTGTGTRTFKFIKQ